MQSTLVKMRLSQVTTVEQKLEDFWPVVNITLICVPGGKREKRGDKRGVRVWEGRDEGMRE